MLKNKLLQQIQLIKMPKYTIIEQPEYEQLNKNRKKLQRRNQQQYVQRLRQVLQINRRNNIYYTSQVNRPQQTVNPSYKKSMPRRYHTEKQENDDDQQVVYVIQENNINQNPNQNQTVHLPKIKKRTKVTRPVRYSQIQSNDKQIIRNYMNAKLIQFKNPNKQKIKKSKKKKSIQQVAQLPQSIGTKKFYTYKTHTPIQILRSESNRDSYVDGNSYVRSYQKPGSSRTQQINMSRDKRYYHPHVVSQLQESYKMQRANSIDDNKYRFKNKSYYDNDEDDSFRNTPIDVRRNILLEQQQKYYKQTPKKANQSHHNPSQKSSRIINDIIKNKESTYHSPNNQKIQKNIVKQQRKQEQYEQYPENSKLVPKDKKKQQDPVQPILRQKKKQEDWQLIDPLNLQTFFVKAKKISNIQSSNVSKIERPKFKVPQIPRKEDMSKFIRSYVPEFTEIKIDVLLKNQNFQIITDDVYGKQTFYFGEAKDDKRHGMGIFITDKSIFQGVWLQDQKVKGIEQTESGKYKGEFKDGQRSGNGQFFWSHGQYYSGQWKNGKKTGSGYWRSPKGESYMGEWRNGQVTGNGVHTMKNGQKYQGQFVNFLKHGFGHEQFPNGDRYQGRYVQGQAHGKGKYFWKNGTIYSGDFVEGFREGRGVLIAPNIIQFEGNFKSQLISGPGILKLANGDTFNGMFQNNKKNGHGVFDMKSQKRIIKGVWLNNQLVNQQQ